MDGELDVQGVGPEADLDASASTGAEETATGTEENEEPVPEETYDTLIARIEANEAWKKADADRLEESRKKGESRGQKQAYGQARSLQEQTRQYVAQVADRIERGLPQALLEKMEEGGLDRNTARAIIKDYGDAFSTLSSQHQHFAQALHQRTGQYLGFQAVLQSMAGAGKAQEYSEALADIYKNAAQEAGSGKPVPEHVLESRIDDLVERVLNEREAPLKAKIKALQAQLEGKRTNGRQDKGPLDTRGQVSAGSGKLSPRTYAQRLAGDNLPTPEEIDAMTARYLKSS